VAESPVNMECRLNQVAPIGKGSHQHGLVIGEIVLMHLRDDIIQGHRVDHRNPRPGSGAGRQHVLPPPDQDRGLDAFEMVRPVYQPTSEVAR
jgi:flavin reductase (DIM6/NTAB) family NADH-FMN oxidoreductase RutF